MPILMVMTTTVKMMNDLVIENLTEAEWSSVKKRAIQTKLMKRADRVCKALSVARLATIGGFHDEWEYTVIGGRLFICRAVITSIHDVKLSMVPVADFLDQFEPVVEQWERLAAE